MKKTLFVFISTCLFSTVLASHHSNNPTSMRWVTEQIEHARVFMTEADWNVLCDPDDSIDNGCVVKLRRDIEMIPEEKMTERLYVKRRLLRLLKNNFFGETTSDGLAMDQSGVFYLVTKRFRLKAKSSTFLAVRNTGKNTIHATLLVKGGEVLETALDSVDGSRNLAGIRAVKPAKLTIDSGVVSLVTDASGNASSISAANDRHYYGVAVAAFADNSKEITFVQSLVALDNFRSF